MLFASTADEEAGGTRGGEHGSAEHQPESLRAAGAINEGGGVAATIGGKRLYPIQVAEKGITVYRIAFRGRRATDPCRGRTTPRC